MTSSSRKPARGIPVGRIFFIPIVIGIVSTAGLISALLGDGIWDGLSWLALSVPIALTAWYAWPRR